MAQLLESRAVQEMLESRWQQIKGVLREKFGNLTDEDLRAINGRYDALIDKLEQRYGYSRARAEEEFQRWVMQKYPNFLSTERTYVSPLRSEDTVGYKRDESFNAWKWLLYAGLPLLVLGGLIGYQMGRQHEVTTVPPGVVREGTFAAVTPADQALIDSIRQALTADRLVASDLGNLQITSANGVITVSGTVPTAQHRDEILNTVRNIAGVRQINNQIDVGSF
jgi:uncharacterized protein YjbJ (UPF0337 family)